jgi:predicted nucleic acid-binding protein
MRVLIDANVLADALLETHERPHGDRAKAIQILDAVTQRTIIGLITPSTFVFVCHIVKPRRADHPNMVEALEYLLDIMEWVPVTPNACRAALASSFKDVEDGIQFFASRPDAIITRNGKDFRDHVHVPVFTPGQFVARHLK